MPIKPSPHKAGRWDYRPLAGIAIAAVAVAGGLMLERGRISDLESLSAAMLVLGGTFGAVVTGTPHSVLLSSLRRCRKIFRDESGARKEAADHIMRCAVLARRQGLSAVEQEAEAMENASLRHALLLAVDGVPPPEVRRQMQLDIVAEEDRIEADARVFEQAGGYAPTIGIIGAVIGLIQVMRQLGNVDEVGRGIAAAFISTLYGVALANLILLPLAARMRSQAQSEIAVKELIMEGVAALSEGLSLRLIRIRLEAFLRSSEAPPAPLSVSRPAPRKAASA